ncbi:hypothetical protein [Kribbella sindirgiensis]|uniref:Uncharacterized protein n=1 Tax=Kribbella sindirgiensis TaxID=1124744 RepID=A0A4R0IMD6_9ACTN|nr:hypothetical protein [Kribbella sindirgiensis]TCC32388.1 hypothetical protein E0H50_19560 [Kribbella sindirgiensis]
MIGSRKLAVWLVLTVVVLSWAVSDAIEHRRRIHAVGTKVVVCAAEHPHDGRTQVLDHLADCTYRAMRRL